MYFVTGVEEDGKARCFGYFHSRPNIEGEERFKELEECIYKYLVVEYISDGIYRHPTEETWYEWGGEWDLAGDRRCWTECIKPKRFKGVVNFSIG